ncbi:hypothetical protein [Bradyrhizobium monzae]|uniref:hypothetical protein n=1 Tax=Bradyrhizobium sp. Oc8 TaxID=2876780 RepID=UPI001F1BEA6D|nr:hypothetical protein [Bradyrhizobium sp. Oc8]
MGESFGTTFTVVEVTIDDGKMQIWLALAKPSQALTLVLAAAQEGSTAELMNVPRTPERQKIFEDLNLAPGDVHRLD